ncbi:MAG TPA: RecQ family ATP-dependent DNA helicase, partial [Phnomibacter sp.]|nr:RecQ family ATP-dependent DNA helicase [Phnomibacter sp.]
MNAIAFVDTEIEVSTRRIRDIGCVNSNGSHFHSASIAGFIQFLSGTHFMAGHNILHHDLKYIGHAVQEAGIPASHIIDTLYLSPLLFPTKPYHALVKDDKLQNEDANNPLSDAIKARDLCNDELAAFQQTNPVLQQIFYLLLHQQREFQGFFRYLQYTCQPSPVAPLIREYFQHHICAQQTLPKIIEENPVELAYCLALIDSNIKHKNIYSIPPRWVLKNYPDVERVMNRLRNTPCLQGCSYCNKALNIYEALKRHFGYSQYRSYAGQPLQERAVQAAVAHKSILAVFPTGGGKSITFQVPALMSAENSRGLTVVISPLQSLMKDQVDNLEKAGITEAVTINGLLDPIERAKSIERIDNGTASILYISPESLRSKTIEQLILGRKIARFVIDEAHCFSAWGQDFRVDYQYIGEFIKQVQTKKNLEEAIPVSCFTATAKQNVIQDIRQYFKEKLALDLELFTSTASRTNLHYKVFEKEDDEAKYDAVRNLLAAKNCPTIIYVSRTRRAYELAKRLTADGFGARPYHGKMDTKEKTENQNAFIAGEVHTMVATSAFGMGVDKKDVGRVIHYDISDSLENYVQEAGRAGRDEHIEAECYVLFNEEDLSKHFILLNQTKISIKEIQQVWQAIKDITRFRATVSNSALEIARKAGWDDGVAEIETRVTTAIAALEEAGYLKRGQNMPQIFANSILAKNAQEAIEKISASALFNDKQKQHAIRIIRKLFSSKSRKQNNEESPESRVDYISDHLGIVKEEVITIINLLRQEKILADNKDLTAFIKKGENINRSLGILEAFIKTELFLLPHLEEREKLLSLKELNDQAEKAGHAGVDTQKLKTILNFWAIKHWIKRKYHENSRNHLQVLSLHQPSLLKEKLEQRYELATFIIQYLFEKTKQQDSATPMPKA